MNVKERNMMEQLQGDVNRIIEVLTGEGKIADGPGLLERQKRDEEFQREALEILKDLKKKEEEQLLVNQRVEERLNALEEFAAFFRALGLIKRKSIVIVGAVISGAGALFMKAEAIYHWVLEIINNR